MEGKVYSLALDENRGRAVYNDGSLEVNFDPNTHEIVDVKPLAADVGTHRIDVKNYHTLRILLAGMLNPSRVHPVNIAYL
jgi:hypothetical protein